MKQQNQINNNSNSNINSSSPVNLSSSPTTFDKKQAFDHHQKPTTFTTNISESDDYIFN